MVVFDTTFLTYLFVPNAKCHIDRPRERITRLIGDLHGEGETIVVPSPALSELLIRTEHSTQLIISELTKSSKFHIRPFDTIAAIELAKITIGAMKKGSKRGTAKDIWNKVKFDRQIVAIAKVWQARIIYSEDPGLKTLAESLGITVKGIADCPLPFSESSPQGGLFSTKEQNETKTPTGASETTAPVEGSGSRHSESKAAAKAPHSPTKEGEKE